MQSSSGQDISLMHTYKPWQSDKKWYNHHAQRQSREYTSKRINMPNQTMRYNNKSNACKAIEIIMAKIWITMLSETRWTIDTINIPMSQTNMTMRHRENSYIGILNQDKSIIINSMSNISNKYINGAQKESLYQNPQSRWSTNTINMPMSQVKTRELSMCNQEAGNHWSTHQTPNLLHLRFKLDPLNFPQWNRHFVDPVFRLMHFHSMASSIFIWKWFYLLLKKMTWSRHLFLYYFF